jgi:hypothetical protein
LVAEREQLINEITKAQVLTEEDIQVALQFRQDVIVGLQNPTFEDKRRVLELLHVQVPVKDQQARIRCRIKIKWNPTPASQFELCSTTHSYINSTSEVELESAVITVSLADGHDRG